MYVLIGILLLGILIAVHEFGHFIAARLCGIAVMEFSIGMGPRLGGWTGRSGTKFSLRAIPLGGYCAFYGEDDAKGVTQDDPRAYGKQNVWKRIFTVAMGPVMNFILAFLVSLMFYWTSGYLEVLPTVDEVSAGSPAAIAGIQAGDIITGVNGTDYTGAATSRIQEALNGKGEAADVTVLRGDTPITFTVTPQWNQDAKRYLIGITFMSRTRPMPFGDAAACAWDYCAEAGSAVVKALKGLVTDPAVRDQVAGPVGTVSVVSQQVKENGFDAFISLLVLISVNLGLMNLLPIPGLDGSRIVFHLIEAVRGRPVKPQREAMVHLIGMAFLFGLMIFFTVKDVLRLLQ